MKEFTSLTPVSKIQLNHQPGPHSPQPQSVSERPLERPTLVRPQRTSTVLIQNNEANQVKLSGIIRFNANWFLDPKCCSLEKVTALVIHSGVWMHVKVALINYGSRNQLHCTANLNFGLICKKAKHTWCVVNKLFSSADPNMIKKN